jgi:transcriptional regulator GlxA family with amidase domain
MAERAIHLMREHFREPLTLDDLAHAARASPCHFCRAFVRATGVSPIQFLSTVRIETAKRLLITTDRRVTDICWDVGYASVGSFSTNFHHMVGMSPARFRRRAARQHGVSAAK